MNNVTEMARNASVKANLMARDTMQVVSEEAKTSMELLEYHSLSFDFTDLLGDDPLRHLLKDEEALLGYLYGLRVTD